jgi:heme exporter protein D
MLVVADFAYGSYIKVYNKMGVWETMGLRALMIVVAIFASVNAFRYIKKIRKEATRRDRRSSDRAARSQ